MPKSRSNSKTEKTKLCDFVVGIGSSAGGLEPMHEIFQALEEQPEMAFILVRHLAQDNEGLLTEVLGNVSSIPVLDARDGILVECNRVYVAPPQAIVTLDKGAERELLLKVRSVENMEERRGTIDPMLSSLARHCGARAVGIILSGDNADGTSGLLSIREAGGLTIAQDLETAQFSTMPRTAIDSGMVDYVLKPSEIPSQLTRYFNDLVKMDQAGLETEEQLIVERLHEIAPYVKKKTGHDFSHYKTSTLVRRIQRRMRVLNLPEVDAYVNRLAIDADEAWALFREILIGVTSFFRDTEAFDVLAKEALSKISENRGPRDSIRIWVPGCSSGEEVYTIGMLLLEQFDDVASRAQPKFQIFGTDIDARALQRARRGVYPLGIEAYVSKRRLKRFFAQEDKQYVVSKELRDICLFAEHNVIRDAPFIDLDLISCRNLMIYVDPELQRQLLFLFHHSLRTEGFLFLGSSETVSPYADLFRARDTKARLWQNTSSTGVSRPTLPIVGSEARMPLAGMLANRDRENPLHLQFQTILAEEYAPRAAVVRRDGHIVYASNRLEKYLEISRGEFHNNLVKMVRSGLRVGLRAAMKKAVGTNQSVVQEGLTFKGPDGGTQPARVIVRPMTESEENSGLYMVIFQETGPPIDEPSQHLDKTAQADAIILQLEHELESTRESLEQTLQSAETTNEELKSSNEELRSMNEEFQSANEELEASREEIIASNETLLRAKTDIENLLYSSELATLFLGQGLCLKMFTPAATEIYMLRSSDIGRPLDEINHHAVDMPPLPEIKHLGDRGQPLVDEIRTRKGKWYIRRVLPYLTSEGERRGMVVTFTDVTNLKGATQTLQQRTLELEEAKVHAELANEAKSRFLANVSHEIRTPMTSVLGFADLLLQELNDPKSLQFVEMIKKNALFLLDIINEILDLAKIEGGGIELKSRRFDLRDLIDRITDLIRLQAHKKNLELQIEYDLNLPACVETDPNRLRQILLNLLENAVKFTNKGYIKLKVRMMDEEQPRLCLEILDTGIGITQQEQKKIFEPFVQSKTSSSQNDKGTGLGLAITRGLVELLGGTIFVRSAVGEGSCFVVEIPVQPICQDEGTLVESSDARDAKPGESFTFPSDRTVRVLVVDDNEEIRQLLTLFLTNAGAKVEMAGNGREALEKVDVAGRAGDPFSVVIMDMEMPEMDGYEATRELRQSGYDRPIIALTAAAMEGNDEICYQAGCTAYLSKPVRWEEFMALVGRYIN
jgi:signal transduction histidine kinase/chemotaxis methyl-accepting protein methylase/chemotaxis response regulator CheB